MYHSSDSVPVRIYIYKLHAELFKLACPIVNQMYFHTFLSNYILIKWTLKILPFEWQKTWIRYLTERGSYKICFPHWKPFKNLLFSEVECGNTQIPSLDFFSLRDWLDNEFGPVLTSFLLFSSFLLWCTSESKIETE